MKKLIASAFFICLFVSTVLFIGSCQTVEVLDEETGVGKLSTGLIKDAEGELHLPIDFAERYPLLADSAARRKRMQWFMDATLGFYPDYGLHAYIGNFFQGRSVTSSDMMLHFGNFPPAEYEAVAAEFKMPEVTVEQFMARVDQIGAEYIVLNAKSHDGFTMYDSEFTEYDIVDAPAEGRDLYADLIPVLKERGLKVGFHYSILDWYHPSQAILNDAGVKQPVDIIPAMNKDQKPVYVEYVKNQIKELVTRYGADMFVFDGEWVEWWTSEDGWDLHQYILELNPDVIVDNRIGKKTVFDGDFANYDRFRPSSLKSLCRPWLLTYEIDAKFGYYGRQYPKFYHTLARKYIDAASRGGNLLLKVTAPPSGFLTEKTGKMLEKFEGFIGENRDLLREAEVAPVQFWPTGLGVVFRDWKRFVVKDNKLYLFALYHPGMTKILVPEMKDKIYTKAYFYKDPENVLTIENMEEVLEERAEFFLEEREDELKGQLDDEFDGFQQIEGEGVYFNSQEEQDYFCIEYIDHRFSDYENVELKFTEWPDKKAGKVIVIEFEDYSKEKLFAEYADEDDLEDIRELEAELNQTGIESEESDDDSDEDDDSDDEDEEDSGDED